MRFSLFFLLYFLLRSVSSPAQLNSPATAGSTGLMMGGIGAALTDANSLFANPAGVSSVQTTTLLLQAENRFLQPALSSVQAGILLPTNNETFGFRINHFGPGEYNEQEMALVYARPLSNVISLGGGIHLRQQRIPEYGMRRLLTFSLGVQMELLPNLALGTYLYNPIRQELTPDEYAPTLFLIGARYQPSEQVQLLIEVEKDIDYIARVKAGIAYQLGDVLLLRTGIRTQPTNFSFGLGIPIGSHLQIDVGAWQHQQLGMSPLFHLSYQW